MNTQSAHSPLWTELQVLLPAEPRQDFYLLVNQAAYSEHMKPISGLATLTRCPLFNQDLEACTDTATPFLVQLESARTNGSNLRALREVVDAGCFASALTLIESSLSLDQLAKALTIRCEAHLSDGYEVLLRYFDTRTMATLASAFTAPQSNAFFSCAKTWRYANRKGSFILAHATSEQSRDTFVPPLVLSADQENVLLDAGEADAVVDVLMRAQIEPLLELSFPDRHPVVEQHIKAAREWGLKSTADFASYSSLALLLGPQFDQEHPWKELSASVKGGRISMQEALRLAESTQPS